ncbi:MAG: hypothetical protein Kow0077_13780 [Anaerolineae bacterium]
MLRKRLGFVLTVAIVLGIGVFGVSAQDMPAPSVTVSDQVSLDGTVTIDSIYSEGPGFIVIHIDNGEGRPGPIAGYRAVNAGWNINVKVAIDTTMATPTLFAMLHVDTGEVGSFEFGAVEGADGPVIVDGAPLTPPFAATIVRAYDQLVEMGHITITSVTAQQDGWLVVHAGDASAPGPVLGQTFVPAGTSVDVQVDLEGEITPVLWPMLHVDTGTAGEYEFAGPGTEDGPVAVNGRVATFPIWTIPHMRVSDQIVMHADNYPGEMMMDKGPMLIADSVLAEVDGWLVVHADNDGGPGPVLGQTFVPAGTNTVVAVELNAEGLTPVLWPMLHVDTGTAGEYEFAGPGTDDGPVAVDGNVLTFPVNAAPTIRYSGALAEDGALIVDAALIDAPGWLVIHSDNDGAPGPVLGAAPLLPGLTENVRVELEGDPGSRVFPMLHYDTGEAGVYEFGSVEGADGPVRVGEAVVVGPLTLGE